jgi:hypothetical protein
MKSRRHFLTATFAMGALTACQSLQEGQNASRQLIYSPPKDRGTGLPIENWKPVAKEDGRLWAQTKDGMDDVISLYAYESPVDKEFTNLEAIEAAMRRETGLKIKSMKYDALYEVPFLMFEWEEESLNADPLIQNTLKAAARTMAGPHQSVTTGAMMMHPFEKNRFITLGCTRTSHHGMMGDLYKQVFREFLLAFVVENHLGA